MANYYLNDDGSTSTRKSTKGTNYIMQDDGNTIANNPVTKKKKKKKEEKPNILDKASYITKKTVSGALGGFTNIVNSGLQEMENDLKSGSEINNKSDIVKKAGIGLLETLTPIVGTIRNQKETKENIKKIVSDKSKNNYQKIIESGLEAFNGAVNSDKKGFKDSVTAYGAVDKDAHKKINEVKKKVNNPSDNLKESLDKESKKYGNATNFIGNTFEAIGNMVPSIAASAVTKNPNLSLAVMAANAKGQSTEEALKNGASLNEAVKIGNAKGALEVGTEKLTGGLNLFGRGKLDDIVENSINKNIKNKALNYLSKQGTGILGEIGEETLSDIGGTLIDKGTVNPNEKYTLDDFKNTAAQTALSTLLLNGMSGSYGKKAYQKNSQELEEIIKQKNNGRITEKEAVKKVDDILSENNNIIIDKSQQLTLPTGLNNNYQNEQKIETNPLINNNKAMMPLDNNTIQKLRQPNYSNDMNDINISNQELSNQIISNSNQINNDNNLMNNTADINNIQSNLNLNNNNVSYEYKPSDDTKIDNLRKSASQYLNNSIDSKSFIQTAEKVINDKGYNIVLDNTLSSSNGNMVNAQIKNLDNGETEIRINPNSERAGEFLLTHEITHSIETKDMIDLVMDYASKNKDFNASLENLKDTYGTSDVSSEVLADISGQLFGNEEFINTLSTKKPNIFKRLYNSIVSLANKITGNSRESLFIKDLKNKWETAYRNNQNNLSNDTKYMMTGIKGTKQLSKFASNQELLNNYNEALQMEKQGKSKENIRKKTGWYKDVNEDWKFEISDKNIKITNNPKENTTYKLGELIEHSQLLNMYPDLSKTKVIFQQMDNIVKDGKIFHKNGRVNRFTGDIYLNNNIINDKNQLISTILHEVQHKIQAKEKFQSGTSISYGINKYQNNYGEIEARETATRKNMTFADRMNNPPFTFNYDGKNENIYTKSSKKWYDIFRGDSNEIVAENSKESQVNYRKNNLDRLTTEKKSKEILLDENNKLIENDLSEIYNEKKRSSKLDDRGEKINAEENEIKTQKNENSELKRNEELNNNSSFSLDENAKRYEDLLESNSIKYYKQSNGDVSVLLVDNKNNVVNEFNLWSDTQAVKELGEKLGTRIYKTATEKNQTIELTNDKNVEPDYFMSHRPTESGITADNLIDQKVESPMPKDMYEHPELYFQMNEKYSKESMSVLNKIRNNPDADITIYRATTGNKINPGDWITLSKEYAKLHNEHSLQGKGNILEMKVKAKDIQFAGDDINEFGYFPNNDTKYSQQSNKWQEHLEENYKSRGTKSYFEDMRKTETETTEQRILGKKVNKIQSKYETDKKKIKKYMSKEVSRILEFSNYKVKQKFTDLISEYYDNPDYNKIKQDIIENFGEQKVEYVNEEIREIKKNIRSTDLKVDDYIKKNITDYAFFRKSNFNKLKLKNEGQSVDSFYNELAEMYPSVFSKDITNEVDQLKRLSEFMDEDGKIVEKYKIDNQAIEEATKYIYDSIKNKDNIDDLINSISISPKEIRKEKTIQYREQAENFIKNSADWVDKKSGLAYKVNTMKRNFYDVMGKNDAKRMYSNYIEPIFNHNAQMQKDISSYNEKISKLKLDENESAAVQMLGEYKYNPETLVTSSEIDEFISKNNLNYKKIENSVEVFRNIYDELFERVNETLKSQGYKEVEYRKGYFPHFVDNKPTGKIGKMMEKIGWKFKDNGIPTSIAGITDTFKPGKVWTSFSQTRKGRVTDYNALKGFDNYIRGAMQDIYFTEDIQKLRALENEIRYEHSDKAIQEKIDEIQADDSINLDEKQDKIEKVYAKYITPLNNFVSEIRDYTNGLANKKSGLDRTVEALSNRKFYNVMENVSNRLSANMVGMNLSSAITNFIPITQAASQVKSKYLLKGLKEAVKSQYSADGFEDKSVFLTSRLNEAETLYKTKLDKISEKMNFMFDGIDSITSNTIVRGKYYENLAKGMSEFSAMHNADEFARDLMAGRTKGEMPTAFNSKNPLIKMFTSFQLEVNNQFGYMLKDLPRDLGDEAKKKLVGAFVKIFLGAWIYNQLTEKVVGRKAAFSPIDTLQEIYDTTTSKSLSITDKSSNILENLTQDMPFVGGLIGGGRLPISSVANPLNVVKGESSLKDEAKKALYYTVLPFGGGQLKKTVEGASMYLNNKKIKGSYSSKGQLRFEAEKDPLSIAQNVLFGQYSSKNARDYFNNGYVPLTDKQYDEIRDKNMSVNTFRKYQKDKKSLNLNNVKSDRDSDGKNISGTASGKKAYLIMNSKFSDKEKNYLLSKIGNSKHPVKTSDLNKLPNDKKIYKFYFGLNSDSKKEFIKEIDSTNMSANELYSYYSTRKKIRKDYTSSYAKIKMIDYIRNSNFDDKTKWYLYNKDYGSDTSKLLVNIFGLKTNDYFNAMQFADKIEKMYPNKKQAKVRKQKVFEYINNLNLSQKQKIVLFAQAGYSTKTYKNSMYNYIKKQNLSVKEKEKIWKALY